MSRKYKILLILAGLAIIALSFILAFSGDKAPVEPDQSGLNNATGSQSNIPDYVLSASEEQQVKELASGFVNLYNTYSYDDYTNPVSLGDFMTPGLQDRTVAYVDNLRQYTPQDFSRTTKTDPETFKYRYPQAGALQVTLEGRVTEIQGSDGKQSTYNIAASLNFEQLSGRWIVSNIEINKK